MQVDANEVIRELSQRLAQQEVELATLRVLLRQQADLQSSASPPQAEAADLQENASKRA